jgi:hypothetical protein
MVDRLCSRIEIPKVNEITEPTPQFIKDVNEFIVSDDSLVKYLSSIKKDS